MNLFLAALSCLYCYLQLQYSALLHFVFVVTQQRHICEMQLFFMIDRSAGQEGCGGGACCQTLYSDQPGSWKWHGHSLPQYQWSPALL